MVLDIIMIPTGNFDSDVKRTERAYQEGKSREEQIYLISGRIDEPAKTSQVYSIYKLLRSKGIKPGNMVVEGRSANTLENVVFSLEKLRKRDLNFNSIGIASNSLHLDRFGYLFEAAKKEGVTDKDIEIQRLPTYEGIRAMIYGLIGRAIYRYELNHGGLNGIGTLKKKIKGRLNINKLKTFISK